MLEKTAKQAFTYGEYVWNGLWYLLLCLPINLIAAYLNICVNGNKVLGVFNLVIAGFVYIIAFTRPIGRYKKFAYWGNSNDSVFLKALTATIYLPMYIGWKTIRSVKKFRTKIIEQYRNNKQRKIDMSNPYFDNIESTLKLIQRLKALELDVCDQEDANAVVEQLVAAEEHLRQLRTEAPALATRNAHKDNLNDISGQLEALRENYALTKTARNEIDQLTNSVVIPD